MLRKAKKIAVILLVIIGIALLLKWCVESAIIRWIVILLAVTITACAIGNH